MKFISLLSALPLVAAGVASDANVAAEQPTSGKTGAIRKTFAINEAVKLAPGGGMSMGGMGGNGVTLRITGQQLCGTCTVLEGQIKLTDSSGRPLTGVYVHHILTNGPRQSFPLSGGMTVNTGGFVGAGDDNGNSPFRYYVPGESAITGYHMKPSDVFSTQVVLVNESKESKSVLLNYDLEYLEGNVGKGVKSALISATIMIKNNGQSKSSPMTFTQDGTLIYGKGHLHDGGTAMRMWAYNSTTNLSANKYYWKCDSEATYDKAKKTIVDMKDCTPGKMKRDDKLVMQSEYDSITHPGKAGAGPNMGMFRVIFA